MNVSLPPTNFFLWLNDTNYESSTRHPEISHQLSNPYDTRRKHTMEGDAGPTIRQVNGYRARRDPTRK